MYVNSVYRDWTVESGKRRAGISAFGLSGTNCHIVLEEAPQKENAVDIVDSNRPKILKISARGKQELLDYLWKYQSFLNVSKDIDLENLCYTANTGRGDYTCRAVIVFHDRMELKERLETTYLCCLQETTEEHVFYNLGKTVFNHNHEIISSYDHNSIEQTEEIAQRYINGESVDWENYYEGEEHDRISVPTYPFVRKSYWIQAVNPVNIQDNNQTKKYPHPFLLSCLVDSFDTIVYKSIFNVADFWILKEHTVAKVPLVPGTVYIEMVTEILKHHFSVTQINISELVFISPLALTNEQSAEVHTVLKNDGDKLKFTIASRIGGTSEWTIHVEGKVDLYDMDEAGTVEIEQIKNRCRKESLPYYAYEEGKGIEMSQRWNCVGETYVNENEVLATIHMQQQYVKEVDEFHIHPALLDEAANITLRMIGEGVYLPFSYKKLTIYDHLPQKLYSYVRLKKENQLTKEIATFDVTLVDEDGKVLLKASDYSIKKIDIDNISQVTTDHSIEKYQLQWKIISPVEHFIEKVEEPVLLLGGRGERYRQLLDSIKKNCLNVIEIPYGGDKEYLLKALEQTSTKLDQYSVCHIIMMSTIRENLVFNDYTEEELRSCLEDGIYQFTENIKLILNKLGRIHVKFTIFGEYAYQITEHQNYLLPYNAAVYGMCKAIEEECPQVNCRSIDIDQDTDCDMIIRELFSDARESLVAYRSNQRYIQQLEEFTGQSEEKKETIKEQGTYIVTGGLGGVGLLVAKYLSNFHTNIVLLSRSSFPDKEEWDGLLNNSSDEKLKMKIRSIMEMEDKGTNVSSYAVDVSNQKALQVVLEDIRSRYGRIHGIFHAAGVAGDSLLVRTSMAQVKNVIQPKIEGTVFLDQLTRQDKLDFFVLFSSISSIVPEPGLCHYAAANSFLNAYADYRNSLGLQTTAINWPAFSETGMAVDYKVNLEKELFKPITNKEAITVLEQVLNQSIRRIVIGAINYKEYLKQKKMRYIRVSKSIVAKKINKQMDRNNLKQKGGISNTRTHVELIGGDGKYSKTEQIVADVIGNALGRSSINIEDGFQKLGGNSILAVKVEIDMEAAGYTITLADLYAYQTIRELAGFIDGDSEQKQDGKEEVIQETNIGSTMTEVIDGILLEPMIPYNKVIFKGCFYNALFSALSHYQIDPIYYIMNSLVWYGKYEQQNLESFRMHYEDLFSLEECSQKLGVLVEKKKRIESMQEIKEALYEGKQVIVTIDCFYEKNCEDCYQKEHSQHCILIYGYNEQKNIFYIVDHRMSGSALYETMTIGLLELEECYNGYLEHYDTLDIVNSKDADLVYSTENNHTYFEITAQSRKESISLEQFREQYYTNMIQLQEELVQGIDGLYLFTKNVLDIVANPEELYKRCDDIIIVINSLVNGEKVKEVQFSCLFDDNHSICQNQRNLIDHWDKLRNTIVKYAYTKKYRESIVTKVQEHMSQIVDLTSRILEQILAEKI